MRDSRNSPHDSGRKPFSWNSVTIGVLFALCVALAGLLVFQSARLHREQDRLAAANDTIEFARGEFSAADYDLKRYRAAANGQRGIYVSPHNYSNGFEAYCERHPIPAPLLDTSS